jgi:Tfp pilus assembly protein PilV
MIEVMMALAVLSIGATGIVGMQRAVLAGNSNARNLATANAVALTWAERLKNDALLWNGANGASDLSDTTWLTTATPALGAWFSPTASTVLNASPAADVLGADILPGQTITQAYCTQLRLTQIYPTLIRAEIRVYWRRDYSPVTCNANPAAMDALFGQYGFVVMTTGIPQNTATQ